MNCSQMPFCCCDRPLIRSAPTERGAPRLRAAPRRARSKPRKGREAETRALREVAHRRASARLLPRHRAGAARRASRSWKCAIFRQRDKFGRGHEGDRMHCVALRKAEVSGAHGSPRAEQSRIGFDRCAALARPVLLQTSFALAAASLLSVERAGVS